jgi:transposase InsO family protein
VTDCASPTTRALPTRLASFATPSVGRTSTSRSTTRPAWPTSKSLSDEKATTAIAFLRRGVDHYASYGITVEQLLTDNGSAYRSVVRAIACRVLGIRHLRTRPYRPQTNGKAERFIRTLLGGWAYGANYRDSHERTTALSGWIDFYNRRRPHAHSATSRRFLGC